MERITTLKDRAIIKVIACIDSSTTHDHLTCCKRMLNLLYNHGIQKSTLTYVTMKYRQKHEEVHYG